MDGEKKVGGAAAKIGVASKEGAGYGDSKTGGDGNDEDGKRNNQSRTGPLVPDDASGTNVLLMTENVYLKSNFCQ